MSSAARRIGRRSDRTSPVAAVCGTGQAGDIARLLLINGPPGAGKSTLARLYDAAHRNARVIEIDEVRTVIDDWKRDEGSKLEARRLAASMAGTLLSTGLDIVVPQYLGRTDFVDTLRATAARWDAEFVHVVLRDAPPLLEERFRRRRGELVAAKTAHPQEDVADDAIEAMIADAVERLDVMVEADPDILVVDVPADADDMLAALEAVLPN